MKINYLLLAAISIPFACSGQKVNWQNLDQKRDSVMGISTERVYTELLKDKKAVPVLVAVIDAGIDTGHEDLKAVLWRNPKEKINGKDDDHNGYADDLHGWSFLGSLKGNVHYDNLELVRQVRQGNTKFAGLDPANLSAGEKIAFQVYSREKATLDAEILRNQKLLRSTEFVKQSLDNIIKNLGKENPTLTDLIAYEPNTAAEQSVQKLIIAQLKNNPDLNEFKIKQLEDGIKHYKTELAYHLNINFDSRDTVGDDYYNSLERNYGTNDVMGPESGHGTHVAGIIGASRHNGIGIKGVTDHVELMAVRTVPNGDERDKDVANAIRYAVDNGAKIINMSFGKPYSQDKVAVNNAVKYAMAKDVLIVHAAGNDNKDLDVDADYPTRLYADSSGQAAAWIEVGASSYLDNENLKAVFSNYGQHSVDVFAPGVNITSTMPGNNYAPMNGTSMACPVVAGLAALLRSYFPNLTAVQVKAIIMHSVSIISHNVNLQQGNAVLGVPFSRLCISGGIVNAYKAVQLAETYNPKSPSIFK